MQTTDSRPAFLNLFLVALTCILTGAMIGATTNMVNGAVSPYYFRVDY